MENESVTNESVTSSPAQAPTGKPKKSLGRLIAIALGVLLLLFVLLVLFLLPVIKQKNQAEARMETQNRARALAAAAETMNDAFRRLPFNTENKEDGKTLLSWRCRLLPFLSKANFFDCFDMNIAWDAQTQESAVEVSRSPLDSFQSPRGEDQSSPYTNFVAVTDEGSPMSGEDISLKDVESRDGKANTALFLEFPASKINWSEPRDVTLAEAIKIIQTAETPGGTVVALADGKAIVVPKTATTEDLTKLFLLDNGAPAEKW